MIFTGRQATASASMDHHPCKDGRVCTPTTEDTTPPSTEDTTPPSTEDTTPPSTEGTTPSTTVVDEPLFPPPDDQAPPAQPVVGVPTFTG
jgi:hypothetical protein